MKEIILLVDYKNMFGTKWNAEIYRGGYNKELLKEYFKEYGYELKIIHFTDVNFDINFWGNKIVLYTSSEYVGFHYKSYIEDVIYGLQLIGAKIIPSHLLLRANNNKVFMEIIRKIYLNNTCLDLNSEIFGTFEELVDFFKSGKITFPCVIKRAEGSMSRGVYLAKNKNELFSFTRKVSRTRHFNAELKEVIRHYKYSDYYPESKYQSKFIIQSFIPNLINDWKVLIYWDHIYILKREVRKNDFRASGSGLNYKAGSKSGFPENELDSIVKIIRKIDAPNLSIDFAYDGSKGYIFEFQGIHFGTSTQFKSKDFYTKEDNKWIVKKKTMNQEQEYVYSIVKYIEYKGL